jgi:hypothetical protein
MRDAQQQNLTLIRLRKTNNETYTMTIVTEKLPALKRIMPARTTGAENPRGASMRCSSKAAMVARQGFFFLTDKTRNNFRLL